MFEHKLCKRSRPLFKAFRSSQFEEWLKSISLIGETVGEDVVEEIAGVEEELWGVGEVSVTEGSWTGSDGANVENWEVE